MRAPTPPRPVKKTAKPQGSTPQRRPVSTQFGQRLAEQRAAVRRLRWRWLLVCGVSVLLVAALAWVVLASPLLALHEDEIQIEGTNEWVSDDQVRAAVVPEKGTPLARLDIDHLLAAVHEITTVRDVQISRDWPQGLHVQITPRLPVALVADDEQYAVLDGAGVVLQRVADPSDELPVVEVPLGDEETEASLTAVLQVLDALPQDLLEQVSSARAPSSHDVQFELNSGAEVFWGASTEDPLKASVLQTLLQVEADSYDVSAPRAPITTGEDEEQ